MILFSDDSVLNIYFDVSVVWHVECLALTLYTLIYSQYTEYILLSVDFVTISHNNKPRDYKE